MCAEMVCLYTLKILSAIASLFPPRLSLKCENKFSIRRMFGLRPSSSNDGVNVLVAPLIRCFLAISEVEFLIALSRNPIEHKNANREVEGRQTDGKIVYKYWKKARRTLAAYLIASPRHWARHSGAVAMRFWALGRKHFSRVSCWLLVLRLSGAKPKHTEGFDVTLELQNANIIDDLRPLRATNCSVPNL